MRANQSLILEICVNARLNNAGAHMHSQGLHNNTQKFHNISTVHQYQQRVIWLWVTLWFVHCFTASCLHEPATHNSTLISEIVICRDNPPGTKGLHDREVHIYFNVFWLHLNKMSRVQAHHEVPWHMSGKALMRFARMDVDAVSESNLIYKCWSGGWDWSNCSCKCIFITKILRGSYWSMQQMCPMTWTGKAALCNMSFIALMTILANTFCYLCTWTSKQMVLQFQEIPRIGHLLQPLERVIQEKFIPPFLDDHPHPELNAPSWHSPQDGRDGLTILSSTAELCFRGNNQHNRPNCHPNIWSHDY